LGHLRTSSTCPRLCKQNASTVTLFSMLFLRSCNAASVLHANLALCGLLLPAAAGETSPAGLMRAEILPHGDVLDTDSNSSSFSQEHDYNLVDPDIPRSGVPLVKNRMRYWSSAKPGGASTHTTGNISKFLLFDFDEGGLNNIRLGWEVAGVIALYTGRTLVLPPPKQLYLIDYGPEYFHPAQENSKSKMEDFIDIAQLKAGLPALTFSEFRAQHGKELGITENLSDDEVLSQWQDGQEHQTIVAPGKGLCDLTSYVDGHRVYVPRRGEDGRLFGCSKWWDLGQLEFTEKGAEWPLSPQAQSLLKNNFVWHPDVFELAAPIINDLGMFNYNSLHARYGDLQFKEARQPADSIAEKWYLSELGKRMFGNSTLYISTDEMADSMIQTFRQRGIKAKWSKDYFDDPNSPIAQLMKQKGPVRMNQIKGPVEQVVCAFGKLFLGTRKSTFSGYINQLRIKAGAPQHGPSAGSLLFHTDTLSLQTVQEVTQQVSQWTTQGGQSGAIIEESGHLSPQPCRYTSLLPWVAFAVVPVLARIATSETSTAFSVSISYMAACIFFIVFNQQAASNFDTTFLLIVVQTCVASLVAFALCIGQQSMTSWNQKNLIQWIALSVVSAGVQITSLRVSTEATVITLVITKSVLPMASLLAERYLLCTSETVPLLAMLPLLCIFFGTFAYGYLDVEITHLGRFLVALNCALALIDRLCQAHLLRGSADFSLPLSGCMLFNNLVSVLPMVLLAGTGGEIYAWKFSLGKSSFRACYWMVMSSLCGACLSYLSIRAQKHISGTSMLVLTNFSKLLVLVMGWYWYGLKLSMMARLGCTLSMAGFCWYGHLHRSTGALKAEADTISVSVLWGSVREASVYGMRNVKTLNVLARSREAED